MNELEYKRKVAQFVQSHGWSCTSEITTHKIQPRPFPGEGIRFPGLMLRCDFLLLMSGERIHGAGRKIVVEVKAPVNMNEFERGIGQALFALTWEVNESWYALPHQWAVELEVLERTGRLPFRVLDMDALRFIRKPDECPLGRHACPICPSMVLER